VVLKARGNAVRRERGVKKVTKVNKLRCPNHPDREAVADISSSRSKKWKYNPRPFYVCEECQEQYKMSRYLAELERLEKRGKQESEEKK
jgi:hypothetical protein